MIEVEYNGMWPNLCSGDLVLTVDGTRWEMGSCLSSGGSVYFTEDWDDVVEEGPWSIHDWPNGFPEDKKEEALDVINDEIPQGCCGGCL